MASCIRERVRGGRDVFHMAHPDGDADYRGIRCSEDEGIVAPGPLLNVWPTCPDCIEIAAKSREQER